MQRKYSLIWSTTKLFILFLNFQTGVLSLSETLGVKNNSCAQVKRSSGDITTIFQNGVLSRTDLENVYNGSLKTALFNVSNSNNQECLLEICGYKDSWLNMDYPYISGTCEHYGTGITRAPYFYDNDYIVSSMTCSCRDKIDPHCKNETCVERKTTWPAEECAVLYQEEDCRVCFFDPVVLKYGVGFKSMHSYQIKSATVRPGCVVEKWTNGALSFDSPYIFRYTDVHNNNIGPVYHKDSENFSCICNDTVLFEMQMSKTAKLTTELPIIEDEATTTSLNTLLSSDALEDDSYEPIILMKFIFPALGFLLAILGTFLIFYKIRKKRPSSTHGIALQNMSMMNSDDLKKTINLLFQVAKKQQSELLGTEAQLNLESNNDLSLLKFQEVCKPEFQLPRVSFEFERNEQSKLGSGVFGDVYKGLLVQEPNSDGLFENVAVKVLKVLKDSENVAMSFLNEIRYFQIVGNAHHNVVRFIGACFFEGELYLLTKLCERGSLKNYLKNVIRKAWVSNHNSGETQINTYIVQNDDQKQSGEAAKPSLNTNDLWQLLSWSEQIASGMQFLHSKGIIHGDLAARNVLLSNDLTAKLCDYGLSVQCAEEKYYAKLSLSMNKIPFNSLAPEILNSLNNSEIEITRMPRQIDVWAFGCTLWEIFTLGESPYAGIEQTLMVPRLPLLLEILMLHEVLKQPAPLTPPEIHEKLLECWNEIPENRPSFTELCEFFELQQEKYANS